VVAVAAPFKVFVVLTVGIFVLFLVDHCYNKGGYGYPLLMALGSLAVLPMCDRRPLDRPVR
jgi:hypothetical protein